MKRRPAVAKLAGAPDVWGAKGLAFCQEAKAAGIDRMIVNGSWGVEDTEAIKKLGYLVSCYDNYEDMMAGKPGRYGDCVIPDDAPLMANGKRMLGWPVHVKDPKTGKTKLDPKTGKPVVKEQFHKRCSALDLAVARRWIPPDQAKNPRNARFLDVTTATGLRECFDPKHRCTRTIDREHRQKLAAYVSEELGLVCGGEHGRWWGVPFYDYWEGMQSAGFYSWPAGHVGMDIPQTREAIGAKYLTYGIGHMHRIPLWELVFGDCVVSTWYWGDSTGHLYNADPDISRRKDLFNMLYGTVPLYWVSRPFSFRWDKPELRERLLDSYRVTCKLHEQTAFDELLTHEWLTPDRSVQKTTFSSGAFVVVNFGDKPYSLRDGGKTWMLAPLGFYARGQKIHQYRIRSGKRDITWVRTPDCLFVDVPKWGAHDFGAIVCDGRATVRMAAANRLTVTSGGPVSRVVLRAWDLLPAWDWRTARAFLLDDAGQRERQIDLGLTARMRDVHLPGGVMCEVLCGKEADLPNLVVEDVAVKLSPERQKQPRTHYRPKLDDSFTIEAVVRDTAGKRLAPVSVAFYMGDRSPESCLGRRKVLLEPGVAAKAAWTMKVGALDGVRYFYVVVDPDDEIRELVEADNAGEGMGNFLPNLSHWAYRVMVEGRVVAPPDDPNTVSFVLPIDFGAQLRRLGGKGTLDLASLRMYRRYGRDGFGQSVPCQFDPAEGFHPTTNPKGELLWMPAPDTYHRKLKAGQTLDYWLLFDVVENGRKVSRDSAMTGDDIRWISNYTYAAKLRQGTIASLETYAGFGDNSLFISPLIYSSKETGWVQEEEGEVLARKVLSNGAVRAAVRVTKRLKGGLVYTKTYTFWPDRIDVHFEGSKAYGLMSRAYYALAGTYEDSAGNRAKVDGSGDGEGVIGKCPDPKWYVVYGDGWAHSCVALSKFDNIIYWDAGHWGGIGFQGGDIKGAKMSYVIHAGQKDGSFGKRDYERLMHPPTARIVE